MYLLTENTKTNAQILLCFINWWGLERWGVQKKEKKKKKNHHSCMIKKTSSQFTPNVFLMRFQLSVLIVPYGKDTLKSTRASQTLKAIMEWCMLFLKSWRMYQDWWNWPIKTPIISKKPYFVFTYSSKWFSINNHFYK